MGETTETLTTKAETHGFHEIAIFKDGVTL